MTREELKKHCERQIEMCELWAHGKVEELNNSKIYQEHKLILELLEQEPILDKIRAEIEKAVWEDVIVSLDGMDEVRIPRLDPSDVFEIIDKYKAESEGTDI